MSIAIINYGAGNLRSVQKALEKLEFDAFITNNKEKIIDSKGIILPGVGAFDSAINELKQANLIDILINEIEKGKPFLGLCLGMQLLFDKSEEGIENGFGIISGVVKKFELNKDYKLKIPHMGWNSLKIKIKNSKILKNIPENSRVYFVHSYYCIPNDNSVVLATTDYGIDFCCAIEKENIFGLQFHPEKSGIIGLQILKNFGELCK